PDGHPQCAGARRPAEGEVLQARRRECARARKGGGGGFLGDDPGAGGETAPRELAGDLLLRVRRTEESEVDGRGVGLNTGSSGRSARNRRDGVGRRDAAREQKGDW